MKLIDDSGISIAVQQFDLYSVAHLIRVQKRLRDVTSYGELLEFFPELRAKSGPGYDGRGKMSFSVLAKNQGWLMVLAAMYDCAAPPHLHPGGEMTIDIIGKLKEHALAVKQYTDGPNGPLLASRLWKVDSFHQPYTGDGEFWFGVYAQPAGFKALDKMSYAELKVLWMAQSPAVMRDERAFILSHGDEASVRELIVQDFGLRMPNR